MSKNPSAPVSTPKIIPFADDAASVTLGGLTIENGSVAIAMYGQMNLTRDKAGLADARALLAFFQAAVQALEGEPGLPDKVAPPKPPESVKNPFS